MKIYRLIVIIAAIVVVAWLIGLFLRLAAWILNGLVGVAAIILIAALIYRWFNSVNTARATKKGPLKIEREPSKEK